MSHECDCGRVYSNLDALMACQNANHGIRRATPVAASFDTGEADNGMIEFTLRDGAGEEIAKAHLRPDDIAGFVSQVVSIAGHDELGRDFAVTLQNSKLSGR